MLYQSKRILRCKARYTQWVIVPTNDRKWKTKLWESDFQRRKGPAFRFAIQVGARNIQRALLSQRHYLTSNWARHYEVVTLFVSMTSSSFRSLLCALSRWLWRFLWINKNVDQHLSQSPTTLGTEKVRCVLNASTRLSPKKNQRLTWYYFPTQRPVPYFPVSLSWLVPLQLSI